MNEKLVFKKSFFIFLIGFIVFSIIGLMMKSFSYSLGFLLGYLFNLAIFYVIIITSDMILNLKRSTSLIILLNIVKLAILFYIVRPYVYIKKSYANEKDLERAKNLLKKIENEVSNFKKSNNIK